MTAAATTTCGECKGLGYTVVIPHGPDDSMYRACRECGRFQHTCNPADPSTVDGCHGCAIEEDVTAVRRADR